MQKVLIIGSSSGIGQTLVNCLSNIHEMWTASRRGGDDNGENHVSWDATRADFPHGWLPDKLDGLVYCPGNIRLQPFHRLTDEAFREDFELNLLGAVRAIRAALPALKAAATASVVLFSTVAVSTGMPMHASIAASKGAVEGLTKSLAAEFAPDIRVNVIAPSLTNTPLATNLLRTDRQREAAAARHPLGRIGQPDDIAAIARFLLSNEASWLTGQVLHVDGGMGSIRRFS